MKTWLRTILFCTMWAIAPPLHAGLYNPDNLPIPYLYDRTRHTANPDALLSAAVTARMDSLLLRMEQEKGVQSLVVVVERIEGGECYDFAMTLGNKLGVGNKRNTGLVIVLATADRCYYILTGEGLEGTLPDAICRRIENRYMVPYLKTGDWNAAMLHTVEAVCATVLQDDTLMPETGTNSRSEDDPAILWIFLATFLILMTVSWYANRRRNACPRCGKAPMRRISSQVDTDRLNGVEHHHETYRCPHCGNTVLRSHDEPFDNGSGFGGMLPPIFFPGRGRSGFGGTFGGGGFGGGSFGGGSFGGGGAGGRF